MENNELKESMSQSERNILFHEAHVTRVLVAVATALIVTAILGAAAHITNNAVHQTVDVRRAQDDKWWLENWRTYAQPQIDEIKTLLKENR